MNTTPRHRLLHLDVGQIGDSITISAFEQQEGEVMTTRHYESLEGVLFPVNDRIRETVDTLNRANKRGCLTPELLTRLKHMGQMLRDSLLTPSVKQRLEQSTADHLVLSLDEHLIHIPWELLHDGKDFLCQKFSMGRIVKTKGNRAAYEHRPLSPPLSMMILADPVADLPSAYAEGLLLRDLLEPHPETVQVSFRSGHMQVQRVREKIRAFDLVHFAGHADYHDGQPEKSGWRFHQGALSAKDIMAMAGTAHMPSLIFSNACQSGRSSGPTAGSDFQKRLYSLADAFIHSGVRHYIGTFWDILDEPGKAFAQSFYTGLIAGESIGKALQKARLDLIAGYGEETVVWASYLLYGDPSTCYAPRKQTQPPKTIPEAKRSERPTMTAAQPVRAKEEVISFSASGAKTKGRPWIRILVLTVLVAGVATGMFSLLHLRDVRNREASVQSLYSSGDYDKALAQCRILFDKAPARMAAHAVAGRIFLAKGELNSASEHFLKVSNQTDTDKTLRFEALMGLGRIASMAGQSEEALAHYKNASFLFPDREEPHFYQAVILEKLGRFSEAAEQVAKARGLSSHQPDLDLLALSLKNKTMADARNERIQQLVNDLAARHKEGSAPSPPSDTWTSRPQTIWVSDVVLSGFTPREGLASLVQNGLYQALSGKPGMALVEREVLEKLLNEMNLSTSPLADPRNALELGRMVSARFVLVTRIQCSAANLLASARLVETETSRIVSVFSEDYDRNDSADHITRDLGEKIAAALSGSYPLRGRIQAIDKDTLTLNIGSMEGVLEGQRFSSPDLPGVDADILAAETHQSTARLIQPVPGMSPGLRLEQKARP